MCKTNQTQHLPYTQHIDNGANIRKLVIISQYHCQKSYCINITLQISYIKYDSLPSHLNIILRSRRFSTSRLQHCYLVYYHALMNCETLAQKYCDLGATINISLPACFTVKLSFIPGLFPHSYSHNNHSFCALL